ncbi:Na+/Ca+ antiporter, CaCA family [Methanocaldococcus infernus ME]|uniref:Na+/Ca+ antiporter, CaCA family n=1 Tax=Methanocaldococcus infernus (strain DSM 11812 / JCM 15783 / ME) TaxID=573063 RepID=D5VU74_METIM|nr:calcium/sodium antiporter [Methanocaldococcus infernus]ADG12686.1 Na+/Ca+ antiporter, CaCA family [Methanocaldococcus infernus ME]
MIIGILSFLTGLILLYYCSDWVVLGAEKIARFFNISNFVIGATIIAFGTSFPEIVTSVIASYQHLPGLAVGNILGSCICNIGLILGLSLIFDSVKIDKFLKRNLIFYILFVLLTLILSFGGFSLLDGLILLILFLFYIRWSIKNDNTNEKEEKEDNINLPINLVLLIIGLIGVLVGADLFVNGAKELADYLNIPDTIIGLTLVALGTSLPELAVSISAAKRRLGGMVLGNVLGSNIADIGAGIGLSALFSTLPGLEREALFLFIISFILLIGYIKGKLGRKEGVILILLYVLFLYLTFG